MMIMERIGVDSLCEISLVNVEFKDLVNALKCRPWAPLFRRLKCALAVVKPCYQKDMGNWAWISMDAGKITRTAAVLHGTSTAPPYCPSKDVMLPSGDDNDDVSVQFYSLLNCLILWFGGTQPKRSGAPVFANLVPFRSAMKDLLEYNSCASLRRTYKCIRELKGGLVHQFELESVQEGVLYRFRFIEGRN